MLFKKLLIHNGIGREYSVPPSQIGVDYNAKTVNNPTELGENGMQYKAMECVDSWQGSLVVRGGGVA